VQTLRVAKGAFEHAHKVEVVKDKAAELLLAFAVVAKLKGYPE